MPKYPFKCSACQTISEPFFPIELGAPPAIMCEDCGKESFRIFEATPSHFKGGGWGGK